MIEYVGGRVVQVLSLDGLLLHLLQVPARRSAETRPYCEVLRPALSPRSLANDEIRLLLHHTVIRKRNGIGGLFP